MSAREYAAMLDDPRRDAWQLPDRVVALLGITPGMRVADVGTGSGYFLPYLAHAVGPSGYVRGEDIDSALLEIARERVARQQLARVTLQRGEPDDPGLEPGSYDLVLLVDTYHHIAHRDVFLAHVARALRAAPVGRFVVVDFREGPLPVGPPAEHKIARAQIEREASAAGLVLVRSYDVLPYQFILEFGLERCGLRNGPS
jgi:ubiquinone/menaquinone biosynthesis C-methylase UbiE